MWKGPQSPLPQWSIEIETACIYSGTPAFNFTRYLAEIRDKQPLLNKNSEKFLQHPADNWEPEPKKILERDSEHLWQYRNLKEYKNPQNLHEGS